MDVGGQANPINDKKQGKPVRQRGRRVDEQDAEGRVRLQGELPGVARAAGQAERLRPLAQPFQAALEARLRGSGRVQECGSQSLKNCPNRGCQSIWGWQRRNQAQINHRSPA